MTNDQQVPRGIINLADRIGVSGEQMADYMGPALTTTLRWLEGDSHDIQDLVDDLSGRAAPDPDAPEAHDMGDGFEMSAAECAEFVDTFIHDVGTGGPHGPQPYCPDEAEVRKWQEVSYHLHWHCANLDGK